MPAGRASSYTTEIADEICDRIVNGESIYQICRSEHMPHYTTVWRWLDAHEDFASKCARARTLQAEFMDHKILELAENCKSKEDSFAAKIKLAAYQWRAAKLAPKKYGNLQQIDMTVAKAAVRRDPLEVEAKRLAQKDDWAAKHANGHANGKANGNGSAH